MPIESIKEIPTWPAENDRGSDLHKIAARVVDPDRITDRPPEGDAFFFKKSKECQTLRELNLDDKAREDLVKAKKIIDEIIVAIETCGLNPERRSIDPSIFMFPMPFVNDETRLVDYRVFGLDAGNEYADNTDLLWSLRALPYFPMESMTDLDIEEAELKKLLDGRVNSLKALAEMMYDLIYQSDKPKMDWEVNYLAAWNAFKKSEFVPVTKDGRPQELILQDPNRLRGPGLKIVIDSYRITPFKERLLIYLFEKHRERGTDLRDSVRRISLAGVPVVSPSRAIGDVSGGVKTGVLQALLDEYMRYGKAGGSK